MVGSAGIAKSDSWRVFVCVCVCVRPSSILRSDADVVTSGGRWCGAINARIEKRRRRARFPYVSIATEVEWIKRVAWLPVCSGKTEKRRPPNLRVREEIVAAIRHKSLKFSIRLVGGWWILFKSVTYTKAHRERITKWWTIYLKVRYT